MVLKVQCPRGTFHNRALNSCQLCRIGHYNDRDGQVECMMCPIYQSTRKLGAKSREECIGMGKTMSSKYMSRFRESWILLLLFLFSFDIQSNARQVQWHDYDSEPIKNIKTV